MIERGDRTCINCYYRSVEHRGHRTYAKGKTIDVPPGIPTPEEPGTFFYCWRFPHREEVDAIGYCGEFRKLTKDERGERYKTN